jgi:hypothetical protein
MTGLSRRYTAFKGKYGPSEIPGFIGKESGIESTSTQMQELYGTASVTQLSQPELWIGRELQVSALASQNIASWHNLVAYVMRCQY